MKTFLLSLTLSLGLLGYSQDNLMAVKFVFDNQQTIEQELAKNVEQKKFVFTVEGILTPDHRQMLIEKVRKTRGVIYFDLDENNNAKMTLYQYAKNFSYLSMFIKHSGIGGIEIDKTLYTTETIKGLDQ